MQHWQIIHETLEYVANHGDVGLLHFLQTKFNKTEKEVNEIIEKFCAANLQQFLHYSSFSYSKKMLGLSSQALLFDENPNGNEQIQHPVVNLNFFEEEIVNAEFVEIEISSSIAKTAFGDLYIAETKFGICEMSFSRNEDLPFIKLLQKKYPKALFNELPVSATAKNVEAYFQNPTNASEFTCTVVATEFQKQVWQQLINIPFGKLISYGDISNALKDSNASRAVGTAVGKNPIGYFLPCHRVVQANGHYGHYLWGAATKAAIIGWEAAKKYHL
jgi:AraC family transcriptional regulator, regulatory protein of adaptative response / methylated-DNA-[protein]-cysteine methyltransferase